MVLSFAIATTVIGRLASELATDQKAVAYLASRGVSRATATRMRVHTGRRLANGAGIAPDPDGDVICFPFIDGGRVVNCKYQWTNADGDKMRMLAKGCPLIFYGLDEARAAKQANPRLPLVITEGEVDCLTALDVGAVVISVPNGSQYDPAGKKAQQPVEYDPPIGEDDNGFSYLQHGLDFVMSFRETIIATDGDPQGVRLREELARRLGRARCRYVVYPEGNKDLNEVLDHRGEGEVLEILKRSPHFALRGLHRFSDYEDEPPIVGHRSGIAKLDELMRPHLGSLVVVTGVPSHGKSTFVADYATSLAKQNGWSIGLASFEMRARKSRENFVRCFANHPLTRASPEQFRAAERWVEDNVINIDPRDWDVDVTVDWLCQRTVDAVRRYGIRIVIYDPWGDIDHPRSNHGQVTTDYVSEAIKKFRRVALDLDLIAFLVAHPVKMSKDSEGNYVKPTLYDIAGSAHFNNKADFGLVVYRNKNIHEGAEIEVEKVRYQPETGLPGNVVLTFNPDTGKYY